MSMYSDATFSVNQYDKDGDIFDHCVLVHVGSTILRFSSVNTIDAFVERLQQISKEVRKNDVG